MTVQIKNADTIKADFITFLRSAIEENGGPNVTDYNIGSVLNILTEAFADVLENYYFDLFQITRESLENIYNGFNFFKQPGKKALVKLSIYIDAPVSSLSAEFFSIPRGTKVSTDDGTVIFEIIDDYVQPTSLSTSGEFIGKAEYIVNAICSDSGAVGNVVSNAITKFNSTITNINNYAYWIRNTSASGGADSESEQDMKTRFQKYLISLRRGTKESLEYALSTNAAFTGLMYSISGYRHLYMIKQYSTSVGTNNYDSDLTLLNKFYPSYALFTSDDAPIGGIYTGTEPYYFIVGAEDRFNNILISTQSIPAEYELQSIEYYDLVNKEWTQTDITNISLPHVIDNEQYLTWDIDPTRWGKYQIRDYTGYFIRFKIAKTIATTQVFNVYKVMTYPFPGYIDIYCLKNYRDEITTDDKTLILESIDNFKAAGVITTITDASVIQLHPAIILNTNSSTDSIVPLDIIDNIRNDVISFANTLNVSKDFIRSELYSYLYQRYHQYGGIYIFYKYDPSVYEDISNNIFKEDFRDNIFDTGINEKVDLLMSDIYVTKNLNSIVNTLTGFKFYDTGSNSNDYYHDTSGSRSDLYLAF